MAGQSSALPPRGEGSEALADVESEGSQVPEYLTPEMFEGLDLPEEVPEYKGKGTSFSSGHDEAKRDYMGELGIPIPEDMVSAEGEVVDRARFGTMFIVVGHFVTMEVIRTMGGNLEERLPGVNRKLHEKRVNQYGDRDQVVEGRPTLVEDVYHSLGFSCNPTLQVSQEQLESIVDYVHGVLSGEASK